MQISEKPDEPLFFGDLTMLSPLEALRLEEQTRAYEDGTKAGILANPRSRLGSNQTSFHDQKERRHQWWHCILVFVKGEYMRNETLFNLDDEG